MCACGSALLNTCAPIPLLSPSGVPVGSAERNHLELTYTERTTLNPREPLKPDDTCAFYSLAETGEGRHYQRFEEEPGRRLSRQGGGPRERNKEV